MLKLEELINLLSKCWNDLDQETKGEISKIVSGVSKQSIEEVYKMDETSKFIKILYGTTPADEKVKHLEKEVEKLKKEIQNEKDKRDIEKAAGKGVIEKKTIKDYVLDEITFKLMGQTLKELDRDQQLSRLAVDIMEEKNEEIKQELIKQYEKLKKLDNLQIDQISLDDLDFKVKRKLDEKISQVVNTRDDEKLSKDLVKLINEKVRKNGGLTY